VTLIIYYSKAVYHSQILCQTQVVSMFIVEMNLLDLKCKQTVLKLKPEECHMIKQFYSHRNPLPNSVQHSKLMFQC